MVLLILALKATEGRPQQQQGPQKVGPQKQHQLRRNIDNCWALVDETYWPRIINFDQATSTIRIFIQQTGPIVLRCLQGMIYFLIVSNSYVDIFMIKISIRPNPVLEF